MPFAEDLVAAYFCATDPHTPRRVRYILFGALGYFILPTDAISDFLPLIGFTDDAAVLAAAITMVSASIKAEHRDKARAVLQMEARPAVEDGLPVTGSLRHPFTAARSPCPAPRAAR